MRSWACCASSTPWSQVRDRRSCSGSVVMVEAIASLTASAPWPASGGQSGGTSRLSPAALDLVERYHALHAGLDELVLERFAGGFRDLTV